jgi:hypothetical protein
VRQASRDEPSLGLGMLMLRFVTHVTVTRKAKVISFEDIKVARAARAAKEVIKRKGKRG